MNVEKLLNVKKLVTHANCADGIGSAIVVKDVLHDVDVLFVGHKDQEYLELIAEPGLLFCDIAPPPGRHKEFLDVESIVLDHHVKYIDEIKEFEAAGLGKYGLNEKSESGTVLAFQEVWKQLKDRARSDENLVSAFVERAGIRDTWKKNSDQWELACIEAEALSFYGHDYFLSSTARHHPAFVTSEEFFVGRTIYNKNIEKCRKIAKDAYRFKCGDLTFAIIVGHKIINDAAEELNKLGVDATIAFTYRMQIQGTPALVASVRSCGRFDCNKLASNYQGGGHVTAAGGLTVPVIPTQLNPYVVLESIVKEHFHSCVIC